MKFNRNNNLYIVFSIWVLIQAIIVYINGIITIGEAEKYIYEAENLLNKGGLAETNHWFYLTQIVLLAIAFKTGLGYVFVLIVQLLFSACATWSFYRLLAYLSNPLTALAGSIILLLNYPLQELNAYMQTDSIFHSIIIIFTAYLLQLSKITIKQLLIIGLSTIFLCITRPTGILFIPAIGLYLLFGFVKGISTGIKSLSVVLAATIFLVVMNAVIGSKGEWDFMLPYLDERIICGVPTLDHYANIKTDPNGDSVYGLLYYIVHNFEQFSRLAYLRSKAFFGLQRSYYGKGHNLFLAAFFYPLYAAALFSLRWWYQKHPYRLLYSISTITMTWITAFISCDDWHNRWLLSVSPLIILLGIPAMNKLFGIFTAYDQNRNIKQ